MSQRIIRGIFLVLSSYFVLWACAPIPNIISPIPMAAPTLPVVSEGLPLPTDHGAGEREIGVGFAVSQALDPYVSLGYTAMGTGINGDFWFIKHARPRLDLGVTVFGGNVSMVGAGMLVRHWFIDSDKWHLGLGLQGGFLWAGIEAPIAFRVSQRLWLFTAPAVRASPLNYVHIPFGLSFQTEKDLVLSTEANLSVLGYTYAPVMTLGVSVAKRF